MRYSLGYFWNTCSLCSPKTLPRFHLSDTCPFLITTNVLAPANQHQLSQYFLLFWTLKPEPCAQIYQVLLLVGIGMERGPLNLLHYHLLSVFQLLHCQSLVVLELASETDF